MSIRGRAWTALLLSPMTWFVFEQGLSALLHASCGRVDAGVIWGVASLALCGVAFRMAWPMRHHGNALTDVWLFKLALIGAGFFGLAILFQTLAILLVPPCLA